MLTEVYKCEWCGKYFEQESQYNKHTLRHENIDLLNEKYPPCEVLFNDNPDVMYDFVHGIYSIQWTEQKVHEYMSDLNSILGDEDSALFDKARLRVNNICPVCYREYSNPYWAERCCEQKEQEVNNDTR